MRTLSLVDRNLVKEESAYLQKYKKNVKSQMGEDGIIEKIFEIIGTENRYCLEFGAWDGEKFSNSWNLINSHKWSGLLVEADEQRFAELDELYKDRPDVTCMNKYVDMAENCLDNLLEQADAPKDFDFACIDVDGMDWHYWSSMKKFNPRLVVIEFNPSMTNDVFFIQEPNPAIHHGNSLLAMIMLAESKGYELVATTDWNGFFVRKDLFEKFGIKDNSISAIHDDAVYEMKLFQLYDGTLVPAGNTEFIWRGGEEFTEESIQPLPKEERTYKC